MPVTTGERAHSPSAHAASQSSSKHQAIVAVLSATLKESTLHPSAVTLCLQLATLFGASRVAFGLIDGDQVQVAALSHGAPDGLDRDVRELLQASMVECREQSLTIVVPDVEQRARAIDAQCRRLRQLTHGRVFALPVAQNGEVLAVVTIEVEQGRLPDAAVPEAVRLAEDIIVMTAPYLLALQKSERGVATRARDQLRAAWSSIGNGRFKRWHAIVAALVMVIGWLALVPAAVTVGAPARVEGAVQRVIAAPVDGFIKTVHVRPGDRVTANQVVVELIDRDLQLERSKLLGEIAQHENAYAASMAHNDRASMVIHQAKLAEARAQAALIDQQLARIQMRAPIDGVIIHGDLSQMIGAPVEKGQVLMTSAPVGQHRVIVELDERDIGHVAVGQRGRLSVSALPWSWIDIDVRRITPMAQLVEGRNVFEIEARALGDADALRPGLRGVARLEVDQAPPLRVWLRRLGEHLHRFTWRWVP